MTDFKGIKVKIFDFIEDQKLCYVPQTHSLFVINKPVATILDGFFNRNTNLAEVAQEVKLPMPEVKDILKKFIYFIKNEKNKIKNLKQENRENGFIEVKVNTAHKCNLNCLYCYAKGGSYGKEELMMVDTAVKIVEFFNHLFVNKPLRFVFFGGEPLLNVDVIEKICKIGTSIRKLGEDISFGMITNGTILTERVLKLIDKYKISLTISIDGPPQIHNKLRKFTNGSGSFELIKKNIEKIKNYTSVHIRYELTYTSLHEEEGISRDDCIKFLEEEFGFIDGVTVDVNPPSKELEFLRPKTSPIRRSLELLIEGKTGEWSYPSLIFFIKKIFPKYICGIGRTHFVVVPNGDIYPCQMFIPHKDFILGNVLDSNRLMEGKFKKAFELLEQINKEKNKKCKVCWAKYLCKGCPGNVFLRSKRLTYDEESCHRIRQNIEKLLVELAKIRTNENKYQKLIKILSQQEGIRVV